ncbi:MAG: hypothetical protein JNK24_04010 [Alphaproteobacteria bacterium]|nr:hypothetical protein [Alphaproteobacteria bacterium]
MSAASFIKGNKVLIAGVVLPFLLIIALMLSRLATIEPPQYKALFYVSKPSVIGTIKVTPNSDGKISAVFQPKDAGSVIENNGTANPSAVLYLYDGKSGSLESTEVTLDQNNQVTPLQKFQDLEILPDAIAPDGYEFKRSYYISRTSILIDIFGGRRHYDGPVLTKNKYVMEIVGVNDYYNRTKFLGWVNEGASK